MFGFFKSKEEFDPSLKPRSFGEMTIQEYMSERLNDQIKYYDKTANRSKKIYLRNRTITVIAGALVPVLVNLDFSYDNVITSILSLLVVLIVSLEGIFHYREQWINSRCIAQGVFSIFK